jgi:hypothetical protein
MHILSVFVALLLVGSQPTAKPDFSGEWKMNPAKSDFGAVPPPDVLTRSITHKEPALTIVEVQRGLSGNQDGTRKYVTDGSPTTFQSSGTAVKSSANWEDTTLRVQSEVDMLGLTFDDRMTLSADGKTLTSMVGINSPQGKIDLKVVFDKQ